MATTRREGWEFVLAGDGLDSRVKVAFNFGAWIIGWYRGYQGKLSVVSDQLSVELWRGVSILRLIETVDEQAER